MNEPAETSGQNLMNGALRHYEEASEALRCWRSDIPKAIKHYYSEPSADKLRKSIDLLKEIRAWLCFNTEPDKHNIQALKNSIKAFVETMEEEVLK